MLFLLSVQLLVALGVNALSNLPSRINLHPEFDDCLANNPEGLRLFNPYFPLEILKPITLEEITAVSKMKQRTGFTQESATGYSDKLSKLPWLPFPQIGIPDSQNFISKLDIIDKNEKFRHLGTFVWAYKMDKPRKGCLLLNHWKQECVYLTEYDVERGAKGYVVDQYSNEEKNLITWPPLALELELTESKWQPVCVSENILSSDILDLLPVQMPKALWELVFLLVISPTKDPEIVQTLMDTGLSPQKGLIAYLRLLNKVLDRAETYDAIPEYRQIVEQEIIL